MKIVRVAVFSDGGPSRGLFSSKQRGRYNGHCVFIYFSFLFQCYGLNQHFDYDVSKPPTILFRHQNGQIAQTNDGKLVITPGAIVHMECLSIR